MTQIATDYITCTVCTVTGPFLPAFDVVRLQTVMAVWQVANRCLAICTTDGCLHCCVYWGVLWPRKALLGVYNWNKILTTALHSSIHAGIFQMQALVGTFNSWRKC